MPVQRRGDLASGWQNAGDFPVSQGGNHSRSFLGGQPSVVYVRISNKGKGAYPSGGNDIVRLYWAKAQTGLSWPAPWDGSVPKYGGLVAAPNKSARFSLDKAS